MPALPEGSRCSRQRRAHESGRPDRFNRRRRVLRHDRRRCLQRTMWTPSWRSTRRSTARERDEMLAGITKGSPKAGAAGSPRNPSSSARWHRRTRRRCTRATEILPVYEFPEQAARALAKAAAYAEWRAAPPGALVSFDDMRLREARNLCRDIAQHARRLVADDAGAAPAASCGRSSAGARRHRPLGGRGGSAGARLRVSGRRQARVAESGAQDRSRRRAPSSRRMSTRCAPRTRSCAPQRRRARRFARRRSHSADGDERHRDAHRPDAGSDVRAARRVRAGRHPGRALPRCRLSHRAAHRS